MSVVTLHYIGFSAPELFRSALTSVDTSSAPETVTSGGGEKNAAAAYSFWKLEALVLCILPRW